MASRAILDSQISALTEFSDDYAAHRARLHLKESGALKGGWSSKQATADQWLQVNFPQTTRVAGIATQGRNASPQWVTEYKLQYREDGQTFKFYRKNGDNSDTVRQ